MDVSQKYNNMIIAATEKLIEIDKTIANMTNSSAWTRQVPFAKDNYEAYLILHAMSNEYLSKLEQVRVLEMDTEQFENHMDAVFQTFGRTQ